ncbi:hypothetical protein CTAYLR_006351 [Chrysophaeum taylorii]|uniref:Transcription initiation factor TFIID subunit 13 n=1 Tax=Chrysophaeum taylorii TaxID=2483200 RepID=A0AAD7U6H2_9STRA|nr:hypothetical protein CTAYLR_006351 [Chrysophaeum taylorii]
MSRSSKSTTLFAKELVGMLYGFGDAETPYKESVELVDQLVTQYIETLCGDALAIQALRDKSTKLDTECFVFSVQKQPTKYKRAIELLEMRSRLKEVRRIDHGFDEE